MKSNIYSNSPYKNKKILVLEGYARQVLPFVREFKKFGCEVTVLCNSKLDCAYSSRLPDHKILGICDVHRPKESEQYIIKLIKSGNYDLVVPMVDFTAGILAKHKKELLQNAQIATNDKEIYEIIDDKLSVMKLCTDNFIPCPKTLFGVESVDEILKSNLQFPIVIKPRNGFGSKGFNRIETGEDLQMFAKNKNIHLPSMVVQECIPENSVVVTENMFIDNDGVIKSQFTYTCAHIFPLKGGTGTYNFSSDNEVVHKECAKLARVSGVKGCIGVDLIIDSRDGVPKVLEINPRICAGAEIGILAGVNQPHQLLEKEFGNCVTEYMKYKSNIKVRMLQTDMLWFLKSPNRFKAKPSFFKLAHEQIFYWDDPLPWFSFLIRGLKNYRQEMKDRS